MRIRRGIGRAALLLAGLLCLLLLAIWIARFRVAQAVVDRRLSAAGVPASYRITRIGPFLERMEDVRLGDPARPDLRARRMDIAIGYGFGGPFVRRISVDGVRLNGRYDARGLHFGTLDSLLPQAKGAAGLPDMMLSIRDTEVALATPAGVISASLAGDGNPAGRFRGDARLAALALAAGGCVARDVAATLDIGSNDGAPDARGPLRLSSLACPAHQVALGQGAVQLAFTANKRLDRLTVDANLAGFGGQVQGVQFASLTGAVTGGRSSSGLGASVRMTLKHAAMPQLSDRIARMGPIPAGTPVAPLANRALSGLAILLDGADADADLTFALPAGGPADVHLRRLALTGSDGARAVITERGGLSWAPAGLRTDADIVTSGGGGLPALSARVEQASTRAPLSGIVRVQPYRAGDARLAMAPVRFGWDGAQARFDTVVMLDGPIGDGFVRGLVLPIHGQARATGALRIGTGCTAIAWQQLRLPSLTIAAARLPVCGGPLLARSAAGDLQVDARTGPIRLQGRTDDGAPVAMGLAQLRLTQRGFAARGVTVALGAAAQPTRLALTSLDGRFRNGALGGSFAGADGAIANVPLDLRDAAGGWTMADGTLRLTGALRVGDQAPSARFNPLATDDAILTFAHGIIAATATLRTPAGRAEVARVALRHDLSRGAGFATLDVPGLRFAPKGLQPEALTPLTLGVVANVAGNVSGAGRIDWTPQGVTSSGDFATDRIDLAAAFGPVTGIAGRIHFTDLLGLVSAPAQATIAEVNPGVAVSNGVAQYQLIGDNRIAVQDARWPFAGGSLRLEPTTLDFSGTAERRLTFRIEGLDAAAFIQQLEFPNISATGTFDGALPMIFDQSGGRIEAGRITARGPGDLAYIGAVSNADLGTMGTLAFDALKAIRYASLDISLDGRLDGEMVSRVRFLGVRQPTGEQSLVTRLIRNLPFRFNIAIRAPFRGLVGSARAYVDPRLLLTQVPRPTPAKSAIQPPESGSAR